MKEEDLAGGLFEPEDFEDEVIEIFPENEKFLAIFEKLNTQWIHGLGGPAGLNYGSVFALIHRYSPEDFDEVFEGIRVMEAAALSTMHPKV